MKLQIWSIGKAHEDYVKAGIEHYHRRILHYFPLEWNIIPPQKNSGSLPIADQVKKEGEVILGMLKADDFLVVLDEKGKQLTSEGLASFIETKSTQGTRQMIFFIGGAYGTDHKVLARSGFTWSLSSLVFPHQLVRLILAEQLYRACTIIRNEKYHHS